MRLLKSTVGRIKHSTSIHFHAIFHAGYSEEPQSSADRSTSIKLSFCEKKSSPTYIRTQTEEAGRAFLSDTCSHSAQEKSFYEKIRWGPDTCSDRDDPGDCHRETPASQYKPWFAVHLAPSPQSPGLIPSVSSMPASTLSPPWSASPCVWCLCDQAPNKMPLCSFLLSILVVYLRDENDWNFRGKRAHLKLPHNDKNESFIHKTARRENEICAPVAAAPHPL